MATNLLDSDGAALVVQAGESMDVVVTFHGMDGVAIVKSNLITVTGSLFNVDTSASINSRNAQSIKDANQATVATDGTLTWRLGPSDAVIVGTLAVGTREKHRARIAATFSDGVLTRTVEEEFEFQVERIASIT